MSTIKVTNLQAPSAASAAFVLASDGTATAQLSSLNGGALSGARNRIINGDMRIWQRGTSFTGVGSVYCADRFTLTQAGGITGTITQDTSVPSVQFKHSLKLVPAVNGTPSEFAIRQVLEQQNVYDFAGQSITASAWVRSSKSSVKMRLFSFNATGGGDQDITFNVTPNTWTKISYTYTTAFGSVTAWTSTPEQAGAFLDIGFVNNTALTTSDSLFITGVQVEAGSTATPFERRSFGQELALCQRYFQQFGAGMVGFEESTTTHSYGLRFPTTMRAAPTFSLISSTYIYRYINPGLGDRTITISIHPATAISGQGAWLYLNDVSSGSVLGRGAIERNGSNYINASAEL